MVAGRCDSTAPVRQECLLPEQVIRCAKNCLQLNCRPPSLRRARLNRCLSGGGAAVTAACLVSAKRIKH
jgi:hypothetical protein